MTDAAVPDRPGFHLVDPSPWPLVGAAVAFVSAFGLILFMHGSSFGPGLLTIGVAGILFTMAGWWRDVVSEAQGGYHNILVRHGLTLWHDPVHRFGGHVLRRLVLGVFLELAQSRRSPDLRAPRFQRRDLAAEGHGGDQSARVAADEHIRAADVERRGQRRP